MTRTDGEAFDTAATTAADLPVLNAILAVSSSELISVSAGSRVYRVADQAGTWFVAKLVHPLTATRTVELTAALNDSPGVNPVVTAGEVEGMGYLLYARHPGDLAETLTAGPLPARRLHAVLAPVADVLERLHALGYVHGDVKPENILLTRHGTGVLADLDQCLPAGSVAARVTPVFAAPELTAGQPAQPEADYFGLAMTLTAGLLGADAQLTGASWPTDVPAELRVAVATDVAAVPTARTVRPAELVAALVPGSFAPAAPVPADRPPVPVTLAPETSPGGLGYGDLPDPIRQLDVAVRRVFGQVDGRLPTVDRLSLQLAAAPVLEEPDYATRSVWRHPAMIAALAASVIVVILVVVLLLV